MKPRQSEPANVKLIASVISGEPGLIDGSLDRLRERFGELDYLSPLLPFDYTDYYEEEMGPGLLRRVGAFDRLILPDELPALKLFTNGIEDGFRKNHRRMVNIDPGYLTLERLVLASCKNYSHRIYLGRGVYGEVTLIYTSGEYRPLNWTYPDYRKDEMRGLFKGLRDRYILQLKKGRGEGKGV